MSCVNRVAKLFLYVSEFLLSRRVSLKKDILRKAEYNKIDTLPGRNKQGSEPEPHLTIFAKQLPFLPFIRPVKHLRQNRKRQDHANQQSAHNHDGQRLLDLGAHAGR